MQQKMDFKILLQLSDEHLTMLLKELPSDLLLPAVCRNLEVQKRIVQVLSFNSAKFFLEDLRNFESNSFTKAEQSQHMIVEIVSYLHDNGVIIILDQKQSTRFVS